MIGNRASINVWRDPWIQGGVSWRVQTDRGNMPKNWCVSDLMLNYTSAWNVPLIRECFLADEATRILAMPISCRREDVLAWGLETDGIIL